MTGLCLGFSAHPRPSDFIQRQIFCSFPHLLRNCGLFFIFASDVAPNDMTVKDTQEYKELHPNPCYVPVKGQREETEACFSHSGIINELDCVYEVSLPVCCHWKVYFCENGI